MSKRIIELDEKKAEEIRKRELDYKIRRDQIIKFGIQKEQNETEACKEVMRILESKIDRSEEQQKQIITEKIARV